MEDTILATGAAIALLGLWHGVNPGMGWLFAVALGMQRGDGRGVWRALGPLAVGHGLAITAAILLALALGRVVPVELLKWPVAAVLLGMGVYRLFRTRHPRYGGMRVGFGDLAIWSFLMASAHGAGLMVLPFFLGGMPPAHGGGAESGSVHAHAAGSAAPELAAAHGGHALALPAALPEGVAGGLIITAIHTLAYLLVTGVLAFAVYRWLGLRWLRSLWVNLDLLWAVALILTAAVTPLL